MSCNGCRVLRKGCSESCILRSSIQWIENSEAQGYATLFVAKFFGRADLMSFISAVPLHQRPALFQSLLFEACGRTVNPVNGAVGLLWSGNWPVCQAAVQIVLSGGVLRPMPPQLLARVLSTPRPLHNPHLQSNPREQQTGSSDSPDVFQVDDSSASAHRNSWTRPIPSMYYNDGRDHHNSVQRNESVLHSQPPLLPSDLSPSSLAMMAVDEEVRRRQNIRRESTPFESSEVSGTTASFENEEPAMGSGGKTRKLLNLFV